MQYPSDTSEISSHLTQCKLHNKLVEFYCESHLSFHCSKCIPTHLPCQLNDKFHPIEDFSDKFATQFNQTLKKLQENSQKDKNKASSLRQQITVIQGLATRDQQSIEDYFDDIKRAADILKSSALKQFQTGYNQIIDKLQQRETQFLHYSQLTETTIERLKQLDQTISSLDSPLHRSIQSIISNEQLLAEETDLVKQKDSLEVITLNNELKRIADRKQVCKELENQIEEAMNIGKMVVNYVQEKMGDIMEDQQIQQEEKKVEKIQPLPEEMQKLKVQQLESILEIEKIDFSFFNSEDQQRTKYIQLRYCSNQIYVYDTIKEQFDTYYLYTTSQYNIPFMIFHNCAQAIVLNHLVFLFGGEDSSANEKSSNRAFCFNLDKKNKRNQITVYELNQMLFPRSEFSISSINNNIYLISGYNSNQTKEQRVIPKCEKFDLKTKQFYEIRDINYPRIYAGLLNWQNQSIYAFGGKNPKYINTYVEKIEKYQINLNDWSVLKYYINESVDYTPTMRSACFKINQNEVCILGGSNEKGISANYFIFDVKKTMMQRQSEEDILKQPDEFVNQNDLVIGKNDQTVYLMSANYVKKLYILYYMESNSELSCIPLQADI